MHIAPCTNASNSTSSGMLSLIFFISSRESSRARIIREAPILCSAETVRWFMALNCVLICKGSSGQISFASPAAPRSEIIIPSAFILPSSAM